MESNKALLQDPIKIGSMELHNRIVFPAIVTNFARPDGCVTDRLINYYSERAKGGAGLLITEGAYPDISGRRFPFMLGAEEKHEEGLARLAQAVHAAGGKIALQLLHAGRRALYEYAGCQPMGPSNIPAPGGEIPRAMDSADIEYIIDRYVCAIGRAQRCGFDGAEVHIAHGYLLNQFASAAINKRTDEYGGNIENRARMATEIVSRARKLVGKDFPILCKLNGNDYTRGGLIPQESAEIAMLLEKAGADAISVSGGISFSAEMVIQPAAVEDACHLSAAEIIKKKVTIPVGVVGRIQRPNIAEDIIANAKADYVCMGRALLADPELPRKVVEGHLDCVRPCILCMKGCTERESSGLPITCAVNAQVGREGYRAIEKSDKSQKIAVIGGGFAGLEAARVAAERGHSVTVYEVKERLGGQGYLASLPPHKADIALLITWLEAELKRLGVNIVTGYKVTADTVPDVDFAIVATGAVTNFPKITVEERDGKKTAQLVDAMEILEQNVKGKRIVVIGGGLVGCETGEKLAGDNDVTMVEMMPAFARDMEGKGRKVLLRELQEKGVNMLPSTAFVKISGDCVYLNRKGVLEIIQGIDMVVWATGRKSVRDIGKLLEEKGIAHAVIGDASEPRHILGAIHEAFDLAAEI